MGATVRAFLRGMASIFDLSGHAVFTREAPKVGKEGFEEDWRNISNDFRGAMQKVDADVERDRRRQLELELDGA